MTGASEEARVRWKLLPPNVVLFGPPGVGKSRVGEELARRLGRGFVDTDREVSERAGKAITRIFAEDGEDTFRRLEREICEEVSARAGLVVACGGGSLLDPGLRQRMEATGSVICLRASDGELLNRLGDGKGRPLIAGGKAEDIQHLLAARRETYDAFPIQLDTTGIEIAAIAQEAAELVEKRECESRAVSQGAGYAVQSGWGVRSRLPERLADNGIQGPAAVLSDERVGKLYAQSLADQLAGPLVQVPDGERAKTLTILERVQGELVEAGLDRSGTVVAVGGGSVTDLGGLAAATFMRGIRWVAVPTTLLGMVDAAIGGKVGVDLPAGKNLVGAFHPPSLVVSDYEVLGTLPPEEWRNGMAELVKAAVIGDVELFRWLEEGAEGPTSAWIERAQAVKISVVEQDPQESGARAMLNAGHTVAHALESISEYALAHGHAVSLGLVAESGMAEAMGLAGRGWRNRLARVLERFGLPTASSGWDPGAVLRAMRVDKKARGGRPLFALPVEAGRVDYGVEVPEALILEAIDLLREER